MGGLIMNNCRGWHSQRGKRFYMCIIKKLWENVGLGPTFTWRVGGCWGELTSGVWFIELVGDAWLVKTIGAMSRWFMVCIGNGVQNWFMVAHEKANGNGNYEVWWDVMKYETWNIWCPWRKRFIRNMCHFLKISYCYKTIINIYSQPHKTKQIESKTVELNHLRFLG